MMRGQATGRHSLSLGQRFALLPRRVRIAVVAWLLLALTPGVVLAFARLEAGFLAGLAVAHSSALHLLALAACFAVLLVLERPRSWAPTLYLGQLREALRELTAEYDAALQRHLNAADTGSSHPESPQ